jgi:hypothetical protein
MCLLKSETSGSSRRMPPTICLNMIVKNESHIIANTLSHLLKHFPISYWVIDDTGSTDGTQQIIRDFFGNRGISGELHEMAWEDFGHNRSKALEHAFNKTDYVLVWDADDSVEGDFKFPQQLGADVYSFIFGNAGGFRYNRNQLFNNRKRWKYVGVLHEYPECIDREESKVHVSGAYYFVSGKSGARSQDPDKYRKDAAALERGLEKEPNNTRYAFYCANSYKDAGMNDKAIEKYKKVLEMNGWVEEKYLACVHIYELSGKKPENLHFLVEATKYSPERLEAIFELVQHYCVRDMNRVAAAYYSLVRDYYENRFATDDVSRFLFVKKEVGDFYLPYMMIIVALKTNDKKTAYKMADMLFTRRYALASEWYLNNIFFNLQFMYDIVEPTDIAFLQKALSYRTAMGYTLSDEANKSIETLINRFRDTMAAPIKWKHEARTTDDVKVFFSITTCKRYDLFERTMNSLLRTWRDANKIDYFFCVDDNSLKADRDKMRKKYPFFKYYMKSPAEKGHRESMNIIWNKLKELKPKYWIHMEDDWLFFYEDDYVSRATAFLDRHQGDNIHQLLFNRNYAELYQWHIVGGQKMEPGFLLHEQTDVIPVGRCTNGYWPHYSFRPSMIRVAPILALGNYDSPNTFFERDYADRYVAKGYRSAFFDAITCFHTGKLTSDKTGTNAYTLNDENQFGGNKTEEKKSEPNVKWLFYPHLDHIGDDIRCIGKKSTDEMTRVAGSHAPCIAVNTLGFLKHTVNFPLSSSPWFGSTDGIYIRRDRVKRIKLLSNWYSRDVLLKEYNRYLNHHMYDLTMDDTDVDYWIIINSPPPDAKYDPARTFYFRMEPWCSESWQTWGGKTWGTWASPDPTKFLHVHDLSKFCGAVFWQLDATCRDMLIEKPIDNKESSIASIVSHKNFDPGHKHRLALLRLAEEKGGLPLKIFGRENYHGLAAYVGPTSGPKENYIRPYKYYFMCENNAEPGYITEKLWEPILCEALCFYWGAPNATDYIDSRAFVQLDMTDYEAAYATIKKAVEEDWWSQRITYIREAKQKVLKELNIFAIVEKVLASQ